jgi:hypothetical protein
LGYLGLPWATLGYLGLPWATLGYLGLPWATLGLFRLGFRSADREECPSQHDYYTIGCPIKLYGWGPIKNFFIFIIFLKKVSTKLFSSAKYLQNLKN